MCNYNLIHLKISPFSNLSNCIHWSSERHWICLWNLHRCNDTVVFMQQQNITFLNSWRQTKITKFTSRMEFVLNFGGFIQNWWSGVFGERASHTESLSNSAVACDFCFFLQSNVCHQTINYNRFVGKNYPFIFLHRQVIQIVSDRNMLANCNCSTNTIASILTEDLT